MRYGLPSPEPSGGGGPRTLRARAGGGGGAGETACQHVRTPTPTLPRSSRGRESFRPIHYSFPHPRQRRRVVVLHAGLVLGELHAELGQERREIERRALAHMRVGQALERAEAGGGVAHGDE